MRQNCTSEAPSVHKETQWEPKLGLDRHTGADASVFARRFAPRVPLATGRPACGIISVCPAVQSPSQSTRCRVQCRLTLHSQDARLHAKDRHPWRRQACLVPCEMTTCVLAHILNDRCGFFSQPTCCGGTDYHVCGGACVLLDCSRSRGRLHLRGVILS